MTIKDIPFNCSKHFKDYPCSHRQWKHKGHCRYVHGYSRSFTFCFASSELDENVLPLVKIGERLSIEKNTNEQHFTQPLPRYTDASIIKKLEELGIGRPSTYASILDKIPDRG